MDEKKEMPSENNLILEKLAKIEVIASELRYEITGRRSEGMEIFLPLAQCEIRKIELINALEPILKKLAKIEEKVGRLQAAVTKSQECAVESPA